MITRRMRRGRGPTNAKEAEATPLQISLAELRRSVTTLSQADVAERLAVTQGYVSKLERQDDMLLSNLHAYVKALGGKVEIRATFPDQVVRLERLRQPRRLGLRKKKKTA